MVNVENKFSYFVANSLTVGRAGLGFASILATSCGRPDLGWQVWLAGLPTELDGTIARKYKVTSPEGDLRDRLADHPFFTTAFITNLGLSIINHFAKFDNPGYGYEIGYRILVASSIILINTLYTYWDLKNYRKKSFKD